LQALISGFLRIRRKYDFLQVHRWLPLVTDQASKNRRSRQFIVQKHERVHARRFATWGASEQIGDRRHAFSNHVAGGQILPFELQHKGFD